MTTASTANRPPTRLRYGNGSVSATLHRSSRNSEDSLWRYIGNEHPEHTAEWQETPERALEAFGKLGGTQPKPGKEST